MFPSLVDPTEVDGDLDLFFSARLSAYNVYQNTGVYPVSSVNPEQTRVLTLAKSNSRLVFRVEQIDFIEWDYPNQPGEEKRWGTVFEDVGREEKQPKGLYKGCSERKGCGTRGSIHKLLPQGPLMLLDP